MQELKIRQKCEDMIAYGYTALRQFPKSERYTLAADIKKSMYRLLNLIIAANKKYYKKTTFQEMDVELDYLRSLIRLAMQLGFLPFKKYENWAAMLNEIGKMLGGWMKSMR
ncbi:MULTISPECIES: diversity-generating retroelement protein Avd [Desulfofundulus]|jgi:four helix bundle protein|uniref:Four helix bundle protein n=1 Tax=Desulfofundulus thermosubterraneus DSM 16057 TaxID=1121432 RepID=A0A1M6MA63_9FIRM|nr:MULTISPECIES: diversity-generating retroelement protein Avd [Desulfofundulus]NHM25476.1 diversity-generating retroelement protein Avd [Desulfofundulus sp. TPOSR]NHM27064.1 diversity-generating retroelement protein Avd [Desulfofundulus sp. TPOSR]SHJ80329.1 four helix bundle protein [Desulfofundulus thermosubterraneus DSM 16057]